jgi:Flp pilus assembly pilin Flp
MIPAGYVQALITYADVKGTVGLQSLKDEFDALFGKIGDGKGKNVITSSFAGKSYGYQVNMTVEEKFTAFGEALRQLATDETGATPQTYADFSCLQR